MSRERWQELDEKATPGPWEVDRRPGMEKAVAMQPTYIEADWADGLYLEHSAGYIYDEGGHDKSDAEFIAAARTAWPAAERECEQLRSEVVAWKRTSCQNFDASEDSERECDQLRALLRQVHRLILDDRAGVAAYEIDSSGLLDDEGQQPAPR
jgi:hypothetical protein